MDWCMGDNAVCVHASSVGLTYSIVAMITITKILFIQLLKQIYVVRTIFCCCYRKKIRLREVKQIVKSKHNY